MLNAVPVGQGDFISSVLPAGCCPVGKKRSGYHLFKPEYQCFRRGDQVDYAKLSFGGACLHCHDRFCYCRTETGHGSWSGRRDTMATAAPDDRLIVAAICPDEPYRLIVGKYLRAQKSGRAEGENRRQAGIAFILSGVLLCIGETFRRIAITD